MKILTPINIFLNIILLSMLLSYHFNKINSLENKNKKLEKEIDFLNTFIINKFYIQENNKLIERDERK